MKKLISVIALMIMFMSATVFALEWQTANQITIAWDPSAKIVSTDIISYTVYSKVMGTDTPVIIGETSDTQYVVTFIEEGRYYLGVSATRLVADGETIESDINWSDVNGESTPNPFGVKFYVSPSIPLNLHRP